MEKVQGKQVNINSLPLHGLLLHSFSRSNLATPSCSRKTLPVGDLHNVKHAAAKQTSNRDNLTLSRGKTENGKLVIHTNNGNTYKLKQYHKTYLGLLTYQTFLVQQLRNQSHNGTRC